MKKIIISLGVIGAVAAIIVGGTYALFNDTETSAGNVFTAGSIDLKVDHKSSTYNGELCDKKCEETGSNLVVNGGFETPDVPTGGWAIYPNASLTSWTVEAGDGLEIQDHAAGDPHSGSQLGELDSNNSSIISQQITTVAGQKYRLTFWYSPRPNRAAGDNTIGMDVKVVSNSAVIINDTIGAASVGGSNTTWQLKTYDFIATDTNTKIVFSDLGTNNSYGGYLDDISVRTLNCSTTFPGGGTCALWEEKDLVAGDTFWTFNDVKPGDRGTNLVSLHASTNDAFACLYVNNTQDNENVLINPETKAVPQDTTPGTIGFGELSKYLNVIVWPDDGDGIHQIGETPLYNGLIKTELIQLSLTGGNTQYVGFAWCAGTQTIDINGNILCSGVGNQDDAQTDSFLADVTAYAVQQRNNTGFDCGQADLPGLERQD